MTLELEQSPSQVEQVPQAVRPIFFEREGQDLELLKRKAQEEYGFYPATWLHVDAVTRFLNSPVARMLDKRTVSLRALDILIGGPF